MLGSEDDYDEFSDPDHWPMLVYFDVEHLTVPAEVCWTCSDDKAGVWVPVTQCEESNRLMRLLDEGQYPNLHLSVTTVLRGESAA